MHRRGTRARARYRRFGLNLANVAGGAIFAGLIAAFAWRAHVLTRSGALAAFAVGTLTVGAGGWTFGAVLLAFFVPSVALSRVGRARKKQLVDIGKGGARDAWQVLANGGVATVCAVVGGTALTRHPAAWIAAFAGAYAAATADTWGTEIGTLARGKPRSILTLRPMTAGLSGGVTGWGTLAEFGGAAWIAAATVVSLAVAQVRSPLILAHGAGWLVSPIALGGVAGALADSLLGAKLQELRRCPVCNRNCETDPHVCGTPTLLIRGIRGFSNDGVNAAATLIGAGVAYGLTLLALGFDTHS